MTESIIQAAVRDSASRVVLPKGRFGYGHAVKSMQPTLIAAITAHWVVMGTAGEDSRARAKRGDQLDENWHITDFGWLGPGRRGAKRVGWGFLGSPPGD